MLREFFYFQRSDRKVLIVLLLLLGGVMALFFFLGRQSVTSSPVAADSLQQSYRTADGRFVPRSSYHNNSPAATSYYVEGRRIERFAFDPNTADSTQLLRLGLRPWQIRNIYKYRAKGGVYRKKEDFARLYGLDVKTFKELEPYIQISPDYQAAATLYNNTRAREEKDTLSATPRKLNAGETIALNSADTTLLQRIPGIGSYWSRRIVSYRELLGGFHNREQLKDLEGFPIDALAYMHIENTALRKVNVNTATLRQLQQHPYINFHRAKAIVDYRRLYGQINSLNDLKLNRDFPPEIILRLEPYVEY